jgi:hypothetical protein
MRSAAVAVLAIAVLGAGPAAGFTLDLADEDFATTDVVPVSSSVRDLVFATDRARYPPPPLELFADRSGPLQSSNDSRGSTVA